MAAELTYSVAASETKNNVTFAKSLSGSVDVSGDTPIAQIASIGTVDETLDLGDISSLGFIVLKNLDVTNFLQVGYTSGTYFAKLKAGEFCMFRAGTGLTAIHVKADTGACMLESLIIPN